MDFILRQHHRGGTEALYDGSDIRADGGAGQQRRHLTLQAELFVTFAHYADKFLNLAGREAQHTFIAAGTRKRFAERLLPCR